MVALEQADLMERVLMELALACLQCDLYSARCGLCFQAFVQAFCLISCPNDLISQA